VQRAGPLPAHRHPIPNESLHNDAGGVDPVGGDGDGAVPAAHGLFLPRIEAFSGDRPAGVPGSPCSPSGHRPANHQATNGSEQAISHLTGLIPGGAYSTFVVHLDVQGAGRFTPWGDAQGTTNNFTADTTGTASPTNTVPGCLTSRAAVVIIWHSDGHPHGPTPGELGVSWHNSLITPLP